MNRLIRRARQPRTRFEDLIDEQNSTAFFVTVNSNRSISHKNPGVTFGNTQDAIIDLHRAIQVDPFIKNNGLENARDHISLVLIEGAPEIGGNYKRVHCHIVIGINHDDATDEYYYLDRNLIMEHFKNWWGVSSVYLNIGATTGGAMTLTKMRDYLDIYKNNVKNNPTKYAPRAFFSH